MPSNAELKDVKEMLLNSLDELKRLRNEALDVMKDPERLVGLLDTHIAEQEEVVELLAQKEKEMTNV